MTRFSKYLKTEGVKQETLAERLGVTQGTISRLKCDAAKPSLELAVQIERITNGAVPVSSWVAEKEKGAA